MLRSNLSTRPFYNERLVTLALMLILLIGVALTLYNGTTITSLTASRSARLAEVGTRTTDAQRIARNAENIRKSMDTLGLKALAASTREANDLIDSRTFSWTALFGHIEKTMPMDAYLMGVAPRLDKGEFRVIIKVISKTHADIEQFIIALEKTGAFSDAISKSDTLDDTSGMLTTDVDAKYLVNSIENTTVSGPAKPARSGGRGQHP